MLLQVRDYILREGIVSNQQLTREFHVALPALQPILDFWLKKGKIKKCQDKADCQSTCFKCQTQSVEYYQGMSDS